MVTLQHAEWESFAAPTHRIISFVQWCLELLPGLDATAVMTYVTSLLATRLVDVPTLPKRRVKSVAKSARAVDHAHF
jgi:hypothetical protein